MNLRPFLKMDVEETIGATIGSRYFSDTLATASLMADEYGPITAFTLSCVISVS